MGSAVMLCDDYAGMTVIIHSRNAAYLSDIELRRTSQASAASAACSLPPDGGCPWRCPTPSIQTNGSRWLTLGSPPTFSRICVGYRGTFYKTIMEFARSDLRARRTKSRDLKCRLHSDGHPNAAETLTSSPQHQHVSEPCSVMAHT